MYPIYEFGSDEQKETWLPAMQKGEKLGCFGFTEPDFGSNPAACDARKKVGNEYVINGEKMWITSGRSPTWPIIWAKVENENDRFADFWSNPIGPASRPTTFTASGRCGRR